MAEKKSAGFANFRMDIRSNFRALWKGIWDFDQFFDSMMGTIRTGFTKAWYEGAAKCGIKPNELSPEERLQMEATINNQFQYIDGVATAIEAGSQANKGKLTPLLRRADIWVNGYRATVTQAQIMACKDKKLKWIEGDTKVKCVDCLAYDQRVYRGSTWVRYGIRPQSPELACHGFNCQCRFEVTDDPCTPGRPPRMTG